MSFQASVDAVRRARHGEQNTSRPAHWFRRLAHAVSRRLVAPKLLLLTVVARGEQRIPHGMQFVQATEGKSFDRILAAFRATPAGRELLQRQPDVGALFRDTTMLESCPA